MTDTVATSYEGEISDIKFGDSDGFILSVGMDIFFPAEIEEHPEPTLHMFHTVTFERPPEEEFISFDNVTIDMIKKWAKIDGDLENKVIEHRERMRTMIQSVTPADD
jgi:hypothetical protein